MTLSTSAERLAAAYCAYIEAVQHFNEAEGTLAVDVEFLACSDAKDDLDAAEAEYRAAVAGPGESNPLDPPRYVFTRDQITSRLLDAWHAGYNAGLDEEHDHDDTECNDDYIDRIMN